MRHPPEGGRGASRWKEKAFFDHKGLNSFEAAGIYRAYAEGQE